MNNSLEEKIYLFKMEQKKLCDVKLQMLKKMFKENPRPLTKHDYMIRNLYCEYTEKDIKNN